jgi:hypothetical protein
VVVDLGVVPGTRFEADLAGVIWRERYRVEAAGGQQPLGRPNVSSFLDRGTSDTAAHEGALYGLSQGT